MSQKVFLSLQACLFYARWTFLLCYKNCHKKDTTFQIFFSFSNGFVNIALVKMKHTNLCIVNIKCISSSFPEVSWNALQLHLSPARPFREAKKKKQKQLWYLIWLYFQLWSVFFYILAHRNKIPSTCFHFNFVLTFFFVIWNCCWDFFYFLYDLHFWLFRSSPPEVSYKKVSWKNAANLQEF